MAKTHTTFDPRESPMYAIALRSAHRESHSQLADNYAVLYAFTVRTDYELRCLLDHTAAIRLLRWTTSPWGMCITPIVAGFLAACVYAGAPTVCHAVWTALAGALK